MKNKRFPRKSTVWRGAVLGGMMNATKTAQDALYAPFSCWDQNNYCLNGTDGREGMITFERGHWSDEGRLVGVFFDSKSNRSPYHCGGEYDLERFFKECPPYQRSLAEQAALPYLQEENGKVIPLVTTAFWDEGEYLVAADPWEVVIENGVSLIEIEMIEDLEAAVAAWQSNFQMSPAQVTFARSLFERKMAWPTAPIELTPAEVQWLESTFQDPRVLYTAIHHRWTEFQMSLPEEERDQTTPDLKWLDLDPAKEAQKAMERSHEQFAGLGIVFPKNYGRTKGK